MVVVSLFELDIAELVVDLEDVVKTDAGDRLEDPEDIRDELVEGVVMFVEPDEVVESEGGVDS